MAGQEGFKYAYSVGQIDEVLAKIQQTGRPDKLTVAYMRDTWLLKNAQYSAVLDLLKDMEFVDGSGSPAPAYGEYQNPSKAKKALAEGIKKAYPSLFKAYPSAHSLSKEVLDGYIKQHTGATPSVLRKISDTFRKLCSLAEFGEPSGIDKPAPEKAPMGNAVVATPNASAIPITMNIQIVIPNDATAEQYDKIFASIKKFLMK